MIVAQPVKMAAGLLACVLLAGPAMAQGQGIKKVELKELAQQAAETTVDRYVTLNPAASPTIYGPTRQLYTRAVMFGQLCAATCGRGHFIMPGAFGETFGNDPTEVIDAVDQALSSVSNRMTISPVKHGNYVYLRISTGASGVHSGDLDISPFGIPNCFPAAWVAAVADHGYRYVSGSTVHKVLDHQIHGDQRLWEELRSQAEDAVYGKLTLK